MMSVIQLFSHLLMIGSVLILAPIASHAGTFDNFSGTWRGTGKVTMKGGWQEEVVCKISSTVEVSGTRIYHKVKCKSDSKKINVRINLSANDQSIIVGNWSASGAVEGIVHGKSVGKSLNLQLSGHDISASLQLAASKCSQKMSLVGDIGKIKKIAVQMKKDC